MGLGKRLEDIIISRNLKVTQVAAMANVSASTLYSIIDRDNKKIDIDVLIRICKALEVSTDYILQSEDDSETIKLNTIHNTVNLSKDKQRLLEMYDLLDDIEKGEILGELKAMTKDRIKVKKDGSA
ncbi:MAG: helix-turn-helix domain-containing protein [Oscillospiraceae bacterium]